MRAVLIVLVVMILSSSPATAQNWNPFRRRPPELQLPPQLLQSAQVAPQLQLNQQMPRITLEQLMQLRGQQPQQPAAMGLEQLLRARQPAPAGAPVNLDQLRALAKTYAEMHAQTLEVIEREAKRQLMAQTILRGFERLERLPAPTAPAQPAQPPKLRLPPAPNGLPVTAYFCADCHNGDKHELDLTASLLSRELRFDMLRRAAEGHGDLPEQYRADFMAELLERAKWPD